MLKAINNKLVWIYGLSGLYLIINLALIIYGYYWFSLIPIALIIIFLYLFAFDKLLLLIIFLIPLSVNLEDPSWNIGITIPSEPLLFAIMFLFFVRILYENNYELRITKHPVSIAIIFSLIWIFITSVSSSLPIVSFKFLLSRLWFVVSFYFIAVILFKDLKNIKRYIWLYGASMIIVIGYTLYNHSQYGFNEITSHWVMSPFFNDHTAYAASIAFLIPVFLYFSFYKGYKISTRILAFIFLLIFITAIIFSYTRAAWISLAVATAVYLFVVFRINYKVVVLGLAILTGMVIVYQNDILYKLGKNKQQSSQDIMKHVQSISNITNDASNLERINRWHSAIRMFEDYPVLGSGPGTYQFIYAPYQNSQEKTRISTNAGDRGNAHSEYLGPLAEQGIIGSLSVMIIIIITLYYAFKNYRIIKDKESRYLNLAIILGFVTYLIHGILNNFLDTDKASALFWGFIAMMVAINVYHNSSETQDTSIKNQD